MKKICTIIALFIGAANILFAQKLTTITQYYKWTGIVSRKYTVLPDETKHGYDYMYDSDGREIYTFVWDHGVLTYTTAHYIDGSPRWKGDIMQVEHQSERWGYVTKGVFQNFTEYDGSGKIISKYTLKKVPGAQGFMVNDDENRPYKIEDYVLESYNDDKFSYTLSADAKKAKIFDKEKSYLYTYDFEKGILIFHRPGNSGGMKQNGINYIIKDNTLSLEAANKTDKIYIGHNGYIYHVEETSAIPVPSDWNGVIIPMTFEKFSEVFCHMNYWGLNSKFFIHAKQNWDPNKYTTTIDPSHLEINGKLCGMTIKFRDEVCPVALESGDRTNGIYSYSKGQHKVKLTCTDGKFTDLEFSGANSKYEGTIMVIEDKGACTTDADETFCTLGSNDLKIAPQSEMYKMYCGKYNYSIVPVEGTLTINPYDNENKKILKGKLSSEGELISGDIEVVTRKGTTRYSTETNTLSITEIPGKAYEGTGNISILDILNGSESTVTQIPLKGKFTINGNRFEGSCTVNCLDELLDMSKFCGTVNKYNSRSGIYTGDVKNGKADGEGILTGGGRHYEGTFYKGIANGSGTLKLKDGAIYEGYFNNGEAEGDGTLTLANGDEFSGTFKVGVPITQGKYYVRFKLVTGETYEGEVISGMIQGKGKLTLPNGDYYFGTFEEGKFLGDGKARVTTSKGIYEGEILKYKCQDGGSIKKVPSLKKIKETHTLDFDDIIMIGNVEL